MPSPASDISTKISELQEVQSQLQRWRTGTVILVIAMVVGCVLVISNSVRQLGQDGPEQQLFFKELVAGLHTSVLPQVQGIANRTANRLMPVVEVQLNKLNDRSPEIADAVRKELESLAKSVPQKAEAVLDHSFGESLKKHEAKIQKLYPDIGDEKVRELVKNLIIVTNERVTSLVAAQFASHGSTLNQIHEHLHEIYTSEADSIKQEVPSWEMALLFFDVFREEVRPIETLAPVSAN